MPCASAIASVTSTKKFADDLSGDMVNVASRMQASGETGQMNFFEAFMLRLKEFYGFEARDQNEIHRRREIGSLRALGYISIEQHSSIGH